AGWDRGSAEGAPFSPMQTPNRGVPPDGQHSSATLAGGLPLPSWSKQWSRRKAGTGRRRPAGAILPARMPGSPASGFRFPVSLRARLQIGFQFHLQLDGTLLLAAQHDAADDEKHVIAFQRIDKLRQGNVITRELRFHLDRL